jgi:hypothetical protein
MKSKEHIQNEVERTLNSLDGMQRAASNPYLFTRVKARIEKDEKNFWTSAIAFMSRPAVAFTTILIALFINAAVFYESRSEQPSQSASEGEQLFASDYNLSDNTIYDSTIEP